MVSTGVEAPPAAESSSPPIRTSADSSPRGSSDSEREQSRARRVPRRPPTAWRAAIIWLFCAEKVAYKPPEGYTEHAGGVLMDFVFKDLHEKQIHTVRLFPSAFAAFSQFYERMGFLCWHRYPKLVDALPAAGALDKAKRESRFMFIKPLVSLTAILQPPPPRKGPYAKYLDGICIDDDKFKRTVLADKNAESEGALMRRDSEHACLAYVAAYNKYRKKILEEEDGEDGELKKGKRRDRVPLEHGEHLPPVPVLPAQLRGTTTRATTAAAKAKAKAIAAIAPPPPAPAQRSPARAAATPAAPPSRSIFRPRERSPAASSASTATAIAPPPSSAERSPRQRSPRTGATAAIAANSPATSAAGQRSRSRRIIIRRGEVER